MKKSHYLRGDSTMLKRLKGLEIFKPFEDSHIEGFLELSKLIIYESNESIIREGEIDNWIYFLLSGRVKIVKDGIELCQLSNAGEVFGEMAVIEAKARSATVTAVKNTECLAVDASYMDTLKGNEGIIFRYILYRIFAELLANRLRVTTDQLVMARKNLAPFCV